MMDSSTALLVVPCTTGSEDGVEDPRRNAEELSEDLIIVILVRLPVKSLLRFKSLSKRWYSLITSRNFIVLYSTHTHSKNRVPLLINSAACGGVDGAKDPTFSFRFGVEMSEKLTFPEVVSARRFHIVGCFNGVVCLSLSPWPQMYALWNPATRQIRKIGGCVMNGPYKMPYFYSNGEWYGSGFCFDPFTHSFKVAKIKLTDSSEGGVLEETKARVNVFSTATNSWTQKTVVIPYRIKGVGKGNVLRSFSCLNRYMHWHVGLLKNDAYILRYDMIDEVFSRIEMPFHHFSSYVHLADYKGSLALFLCAEKWIGTRKISFEVQAWVMNDCSGADQSWSKLHTGRRRPGKIGPDEEVFIKGSDCMGRMSELMHATCRQRTFLYSESLASLN